MTFYFRTFRRVLLGIMLFISAVTIVLAFLLLPSFSHNVVPWLLVSIQTLSFMRNLWSITRKSLLNSNQSVASEAIGLFSLFPFHLILALIVATTEVKDKTSPEIYVLLQIFVIGGSIIHIVYTTGLIIVSMITVSAFDGDVWIRDIDSSPSPFPMAVLIAFLRPRPSAWLHRGSDEQDRTDMTERSRLEVHCLSPCICPPKPEWTRWPEESEVDASRGPMKNARSLSHILVRVPDAAEQRTSISISFEAVR